MKPVALLLFVCQFALLVSIADAQETTPAKRKTPSLTTDDVRYGAPSKVVEVPVELTDTVPNPGSSSTATINIRNILSKAFVKMANVQSLRTRITISGNQPGATETVIEAVRPDRIHLTNAQMEVFVIGPTGYFKESGGDWKKIDLGISQMNVNELQLNPALLIDNLFATSSLKLSGRVIGKAMLDSTLTTVYEIIGTDKKDEKGVIRTWIGEADQLPRKMEISSPDNLMNMSIRFSDFNAPFTINPPTLR
jgi:hypothetical protein